MARMRGSGDSGSGFGAGGFFGKGRGGLGGGGVRYVCLVCNHRYKRGEFPRCGSKVKRADF